MFRLARAHAPAIVFFDEIDAIAGARGLDGATSASGVGDRLLTQLLTELDGIVPARRLVFVAATNRPDMLDAALLRPGRIDKLIYVGMPDTATRTAILDIQFARMPFVVRSADLAAQTEGYSGAELVQLCQQAGLYALEASVHATRIEAAHVARALAHVVPRTDAALLRHYDRFRNAHKHA